MLAQSCCQHGTQSTTHRLRLEIETLIQRLKRHCPLIRKLAGSATSSIDMLDKLHVC
ncbi:hypothetical protein Spb1_00670 [Planctopirus ephydatiae]|uniref:Uncharacterized protein n=1 Tax=Planctopirus ephydatiae TaxID=2528019 RepID=A0A518GHY8_9PLAN|nr:hypothetical protein Spb1_00670 [Planctopirus ephydatiae]